MAGVVVALLVDFDGRRDAWCFLGQTEDACALDVHAEPNKADVVWSEHEGEDSEEAFALGGVVRFADACEELDVCVDQLLAHSVDDDDLRQSLSSGG